MTEKNNGFDDKNEDLSWKNLRLLLQRRAKRKLPLFKKPVTEYES